MIGFQKEWNGLIFLVVYVKFAQINYKLEPLDSFVTAEIFQTQKLPWEWKIGVRFFLRNRSTCEGQCSWADFAKEVFRLAGKDMEVEYVTTAQYLADYPQQAARPANSVLANYMFKMTNGHMFATWEEAIAEYMKTLV